MRVWIKLHLGREEKERLSCLSSLPIHGTASKLLSLQNAPNRGEDLIEVELDENNCNSL